LAYWCTSGRITVRGAALTIQQDAICKPPFFSEDMEAYDPTNKCPSNPFFEPENARVASC
jgi:hypothetical protein